MCRKSLVAYSPFSWANIYFTILCCDAWLHWLFAYQFQYSKRAASRCENHYREARIWSMIAQRSLLAFVVSQYRMQWKWKFSATPTLPSIRLRLRHHHLSPAQFSLSGASLKRQRSRFAVTHKNRHKNKTKMNSSFGWFHEFRFDLEPVASREPKIVYRCSKWDGIEREELNQIASAVESEWAQCARCYSRSIIRRFAAVRGRLSFFFSPSRLFVRVSV